VLVDSGGFGVMRGVHALPRLAFEASGGVLPIAPIYLLAIPGLLKFWRGRPIVGVTVSLVVAVVAALTAGHAWSGGGTTPGRLVAAVLPLLMLPVADAIVTWRASKTWIVLVAVLAVVSVDNGLTYNLFFDRAGPLFRYEGLSGWRTPLLFPAGVSWIDLTPSFVLWLAIGGFAFAANWLSHSTDPGMRRFYAFRAWTPPVALVFVVVATAGSLMVVTIGAPIDPRNLVREDRARTRLLTHHLDRPGGTMWSVGGRLDPVGVFPNPPDVTVTLAASAARAASRTDLRLTVQGKGGGVAWGTAAVDYGDGSKKQIVSIVGERVLTHRYEQPGVFPTRVEFNARGASVVETASIGVLPARDRSQRAGPPVPKLPDSLLRHPVSLEIDRIVFGEAVITIDCTVGWRHRPPPRGGYWVWMASAYLALTQPRLVAAEFQETDAGRRVQLTIPAEAAPSPGNLTALLVGVTMRGNEGGESISRSEPIGVNWPTASLVAGSPIEMRTADLHP
jgi:hypothetical protein